MVKSIRVKGSVLISEAELIAQVQDLVGKELSFSELQDAALGLMGYYAKRGYLANVFLPPQQVGEGVVEFQVVEGRLGALNIERQGDRIDAARVGRFITQRLPTGAPMDVRALGEALNILNDQPGLQVASALLAGKAEGDVDLNVLAKSLPLVGFNLGLNNQGSRSTGAVQASGGISLANPSGHFDAASLLLNKSEGSSFSRGEYSIALGDRGLRVGVNASVLKYRLVQAQFEALQAAGTADTVGLTVSYPLAQRTDFRLSLSGSSEAKKLVDRTVAGETGNRQVRVSTVGVNGSVLADPEGLGAFISFGAAVTAGDTEQRNAEALAADQTSRRTEGGFSKIGWNAGVFRGLDENWTFTGGARGQMAAKNLDSSERFSLGGPSGVRGYPASQATGDGGWLLNLALSRRLGNKLSLGAFVDTGRVKVNQSIPVGTTTPNRYSLSAAGLTLQWQPMEQSLLGVTLAMPLGSNPGSNNGINSDGSRANKARVWLSFSAQL